jgi:hypothetical protein
MIWNQRGPRRRSLNIFEREVGAHAHGHQRAGIAGGGRGGQLAVGASITGSSIRSPSMVVARSRLPARGSARGRQAERLEGGGVGGAGALAHAGWSEHGLEEVHRHGRQGAQLGRHLA